MKTILLISNKAALLSSITKALENSDGQALIAADVKAGLRLLAGRPIALIVIDLELALPDDFSGLKELNKIAGATPVIALAAAPDRNGLKQVIDQGIFDYLVYPFSPSRVLQLLKKADDYKHLLRSNLGLDLVTNEVIGVSPGIKELFRQITVIAPTEMTVMLQGESGSGKEVVARLIHQNSLRRANLFISVDCGSLSDSLIESELFGHEAGSFTGAHKRNIGQIEMAHRGTLFLDEISNLSLTGQMKLLRVLEEKEIRRVGGKNIVPVDIRVIAATNQLLADHVRRGLFREDLFYRLKEFSIDIPSLCSRKEDIPILANHFLLEFNLKLGKTVSDFSPEAMALLVDYRWPGNTREFKNTVKRAVLAADDIILPEHISRGSDMLSPVTDTPSGAAPDPAADLSKGTGLKELVRKYSREIEKIAIMTALKQSAGNKSRAARILKIDYKTLCNRLKEFRAPADKKPAPEGPETAADRAAFG